MTIDPAILRALQAAGASAEMLIAAVEASHAADLAKKAERRAKDAERQRKSRLSRNVTVTPRDSAGQGVTGCDTPPSPLSPNDNSKPLTPLTPQNSEPNGSAAQSAAPVLASPVDRIWAAAPELSALANRPEPAIRSFLGKALKEFDAELVEPIISAALSVRTGDPCGYITRALKPAQPKARASPFAVPNAFEDFDPEAMKRERREREQRAAGGIQ